MSNLGLNSVFDKLRQGCIENEEFLAVATARAEAETLFGTKLLEIKQTQAPRKDGFDRDEGATVRKAYEGIIDGMAEEGKHHIQVADNISIMVLEPFKQWADTHKGKVEHSAEFLKQKVRIYEKEGQEVQKIQRKYFNKCRLLDEAKEAEDAEKANASVLTEEFEKASLKDEEEKKQKEAPKEPEKVYEDDEDDDEPIELAEVIYSSTQVRDLLRLMLSSIVMKEVKVPIMGTYQNISTGSDIVSWLQENVSGGNVAVAEHFGQDLITHGFLRLIGQVGNKFANSTTFNYQWKKGAFLKAGIERPGASKENTFVSQYINSYLTSSTTTTVVNPDETNIQRLHREVQDLDQKYKSSVIALDDARCDLEESIYEHISFMEQCEVDRLNAIKHVILDFLASLSNIVPSMQASVDKYLLYQEAVVPDRDILYFLETYKTGGFAPRVPVYDNYYSPAEGWTFGVDLELRSRGDGNNLPYIISAILSHLEVTYRSLEKNQRLELWTTNADLHEVHLLRKELNNGQPVQDFTLNRYTPVTVASVLKLYLRELPTSVIPYSYYDSIKMIYTESGSDTDLPTRLRQIQGTLGQVRSSHITVLDALTKHLDRILSAIDPSSKSRELLFAELAPCILRPRVQTSITLSDRHPQRLIKDLLEHRKEIFTEVRRLFSIDFPESRASSFNYSRPENNEYSLPEFTETSEQLLPEFESRTTSFHAISDPIIPNSVHIPEPTTVPQHSVLDKPLYRGPLQRSSASRLDPGILKVRGPRQQPRSPVTLVDSPALKQSPDSVSSKLTNSPRLARKGNFMGSPQTPGGRQFNSANEPETISSSDSDSYIESDDEPAITRVQPTPPLQ